MWDIVVRWSLLFIFSFLFTNLSLRPFLHFHTESYYIRVPTLSLKHQILGGLDWKSNTYSDQRSPQLKSAHNAGLMFEEN